MQQRQLLGLKAKKQTTFNCTLSRVVWWYLHIEVSCILVWKISNELQCKVDKFYLYFQLDKNFIINFFTII